tara:strand:+ start:2222 stop:3775 length:1554 start_codon:yes stop_codon:yes gene_type:complete
MAENRTLFTAELDSKKFDASAKKMAAGWKKATEQITKGNKTLAGSFKAMFGVANKEVKKSKLQFEGWRLSLLFMSQSVKRSFTTILKSSTQTFLKIEQGMTAQGQALTALSAEWEFLKFSIGSAIAEALLPFLPLLLEIISGISAWANEHPELTAALVILGLTLGVVVGLVSTFGLLINGLAMAGLIGPTTSLAGALGGLALGFATLVFWVAFVIAMWKLLNFVAPESMGTFLEGLIDMLKGVFALLTGDFDKAFVLIAGGIAKMAAGIAGAIMVVINTIVTGGFAILQEAVSRLLFFISDQLEKIPFIGDALAGKGRESATGLHEAAVSGFEGMTGRNEDIEGSIGDLADSITEWQGVADESATAAENVTQNTALINEDLMSMQTGFGETSTAFTDTASEIGTSLDAIEGDIFSFADSIESRLGAIGGDEGDNANTGGFVTSSGIKRFQGGGVVPGAGNRDTVPALLTPGELVVNPKRGQTLGTNIGSINITVNTTGGVDGDQLAEEILESMKRRR